MKFLSHQNKKFKKIMKFKYQDIKNVKKKETIFIVE